MSYPPSAAYPSERICIIQCRTETLVYANAGGFRVLGVWIAWLGEAIPHHPLRFDVLSLLESEESRFRNARPRNVWSLRHPDIEPYKDLSAGKPSLSFHITGDDELDVLAEGQASGFIPEEWLRSLE